MTTHPVPAARSAELEYARPDIHVGAGENESPWIELLPDVFIRHLAFDVRRNAYQNIIWVRKGGTVGRHRHRGAVDGFCLEGSWRYLEYDWVARPGSFVHESPGVIHTLHSEEGMKTYFSIQGNIEFFDADDNLIAVHDVFYLINHYVTHCRDNGLLINESIFL
jgi:2,4'-dihydroxyacetophenone dioxygenase